MNTLTMNNLCRKKTLTFLLLLVLSSAVVACDNGSSMSADAYQRYVLETLKGDPLRDSGLGDVVSITIGDLGCDGDLCTDRIRFQYLNEEVGPRRVVVADYKGRVCERDEVLPPGSQQQFHETICQSIETVFKILDRVTLHASSALRLSAPQQTDGMRQLLQEFSNRLADEREQLETLQNNLRAIEWLRSVL